MVIPKTEVLVSIGGTVHARHEVAPGEYELGRDPACSIRIDAEQIAGHHARLTVNYSEWLIEDLGSPAGTRLDGEPVTEPRRIFSGQRLELGAATVELHRVHGATQPGDSLPPDLAAVRALLPGDAPRYAIGAVVAHGGMGAILAAREGGIEREVAMKVMLASGSEAQAVRFVQEAKITGQLEHPNIVPVHELSVDEHGQPYYTMKLVRGVTLKAVLARIAAAEAEVVGEYPLSALLTAFQKVCDAVAFAHSRGIIHRDLKPENLMLGDYGEVLVMDWGLAKELGGTRSVASQEPGSDGAEPSRLDPRAGQQTHDGTILGTPQYMSPEQARGEVGTLDERTDIYALGAILYSILTLRPPVEGADAHEIVEKVARGEILDCGDLSPLCGERKLASAAGTDGPPRRTSPPHPKAPTSRRTPNSLAAVVRKAMAFERDARYPTVAALQAEITAYQTGFATAAEHAGLLKQLALLIQRHRGAFATAAAAWFLITALAVWFVLNLRASERKATRHAEIAAANEQRANTESEARRRALAAAQLALAEAAYREHDGPAMQAALAAVPADLSDGTWRYLLEQADTSLARVSTGSDVSRGVAAHPTQPGVFAVTDSTHRVTILQARTGVRLLQFEIGLKKDKPVTAYTLAFSPDGERLAVGIGGTANTCGIAIHSARDGRKMLAWESAVVGKLQFSPDGRRLLHCNRTLQLWDAASGQLLWTFTPDKWVHGHITPDGRHVVVPHARAFHYLKMEDGTDAGARGSTTTDVHQFAISPDGDTALWDDNDGAVRGLDLNDGRLLFASRVPTTSRGIQVAFTPDGERFVSVAMLSEGRQAIQILDAKTGTPVRSLVGGIGQARAISVHPLSGELLIGGPNSRLWEIADTAPRWLLRYAAPRGESALVAAFAGSDDLIFGPAGTFPTALLDLRGPSTLWKDANKKGTRCAINSDGRIAALTTSGSERTHIQVIRREGATVDSLNAFDVPGGRSAVRLNAAGDRVIVYTVGNGRLFAVFDPTTGAQLTALDNKSLAAVRDPDWIGGGARVVGLATANRPRGAARSEEQLIVWDAATGQRLHTAVHPTALDVLAVAPGGRSFAAAGADKLVHVFDAETLAERQSFRAHDGPITALAWHPTRPLLATGSEDLTIKLWNLETGQRLETLRGPAAKPGVLTFSPSGQRLACAAWDRTVRIWEPAALR